MSNALAIISAAVDLLQLANIGLSEWQKVSDIIGKRIAENRDAWTDAEKDMIQDAMEIARNAAIDSVENIQD